MRKKNKLLILFLLLSAFSLFARDVEIIVHDYDLFLPLEGAVVRSWDGSEHICNEDGIAVIQAPENRQVIIHVMYPGYETGRIVVPLAIDSIIVNLHLSNILESRELVIEASRPGTSETQTGRSIALTGREITQSAEIGIIEDVMSSIKLLPGVGYAGFFNAQPSIRGGDPGDLRASLDGFYVFNPYHWGGGFSIFSPRMVESAQLSHGVFSSRHGHTISGLLDITSRNPSPTDTEFDLGISTSTAAFSLSIPIAEKGGILFMGTVTYYDPLVWLAQAILPDMTELQAITTSPYIRSVTIAGNYRFSSTLEMSATGFFGMDGVGVNYEFSSQDEDLNSDANMKFDWTNYNAFLTTALTWNPNNNSLLRFIIGSGYHDSIYDADVGNTIRQKSFSQSSRIGALREAGIRLEDAYDLDTYMNANGSEKGLNAQARIDFDWEINNNFLFAAGVQGMYFFASSANDQRISSMERLLNELDETAQQVIISNMLLYDSDFNILLLNGWLLDNNMYVSFPLDVLNMNIENHSITSSAFSLVEFSSTNNRFNAELGLRADHFYITDGKDLSLQSQIALNPRLNIDFTVFRDLWVIHSFSLSAGTGLFSSISDMVLLVEEKYNFTEIKPNRSWTSILGARFEFFEGFTFNIEGYFKYIFDRTYIPINIGYDGAEILPGFDGEGRVWGVDFMLQKRQSRFWDGWISYSYNWTKYRDPRSGTDDVGYSGGNTEGGWYYPTFHRFHNLNLVLNFRPRQNFNIYTRFGIASGAQMPRLIGSGPESYPVYVIDRENPENSKIIEKYFWESRRDENHRSTPTFMLDVKFSLFGGSRSGKTRYEIYFALENILTFLNPSGNPMYNEYTGEVYDGSSSAAYNLPIPIPSFGIKFSY